MTTDVIEVSFFCASLRKVSVYYFAFFCSQIAKQSAFLYIWISTNKYYIKQIYIYAN